MGQWLGEHFLQIQIWILVAVGVLAFYRSMFRSSSESGFKVRESDRLKNAPGSSGESLADAKLKPQSKPLQLTGLSLNGAPHEILGVPPNATEPQIQHAFRELMKRYHPDRVGRQGSREWQDAQEIAATLGHAKDTMIAAIKSRK